MSIKTSFFFLTFSCIITPMSVITDNYYVTRKNKKKNREKIRLNWEKYTLQTNKKFKGSKPRGQFQIDDCRRWSRYHKSKEDVTKYTNIPLSIERLFIVFWMKTFSFIFFLPVLSRFPSFSSFFRSKMFPLHVHYLFLLQLLTLYTK